MRGFSRQERGELFHSFSFPGPDFPSHLDFPSPLVPPPPPTPPMGLTLVVSITRVLIRKEKEACLIKEEGFQLKLGGGIWG